MLYTASQAGALVVALLFCPFLSPHSLHLFCKFALDFLFADFQCVKRHPRPNQGRGCHFCGCLPITLSAAVPGSYPPAGGIGVRGFPLQAAQNVHLRDACALAARGRRGPWPRQRRGFPSEEDRFLFTATGIAFPLQRKQHKFLFWHL